MLILASQSPRRKELLKKICKEFQIVPADVNEQSNFELPRQRAQEIATHKALSVLRHNIDATVIGCDTIVDLNGNVLGKPSSKEEAKNMLQALSGKTHFVHTGVCVASKNNVFSDVATTKVEFKKLSDKEIDDYIASGSPMDKAGAYGIQDSNFVSKIDGSYDNVVGFPTELIREIFQSIK